MAIDKVNLATVEKMWRREVEAAHTYKLLADRESDAKRRDILLRLAEQEDKHAARWSERIHATTGRVPDPKEIERGLTWFQKISDPTVVLNRLEQEETKADAEYGELMAQDQDLRGLPRFLTRDSRSHEVIRVIRRKTNRRHMTGDHQGRLAGRATLLVTAAGEILGTHNTKRQMYGRARPDLLRKRVLLAD